jgi:FtsP/CotA-like multicopper oxidase with cupredoxin domain
MLALLLLASASVLLPARPTPSPSPPPSTTCNEVPPTKEISNPPELKSVNGVLEVTLHLRGDPIPSDIEGLCWWYQVSSSYQTWVPPTLRLKQGEELRLTLVNELMQPPGSDEGLRIDSTPQQAAMGAMDLGAGKDPYALMCGQQQLSPTPTPDPVTGRIYGYHRPPWNETNMHFHGLNVSPKQPSDNVVGVLLCAKKRSNEPPKSYTYVVDIPRNEPPGTYWYHPHAHGESERQVLSQLTGAIIIDPIGSSLPQQLPNRVLIVRDLGAPGSVSPELAPGAREARALSPSLAMIRKEAAANAIPTPHYYPPFRFGPPQACPQGTGPRIPHDNTKALLINGVPLPLFPNKDPLLPHLTMTQGTTEYWRLANTGADTILDVTLFVNGKRTPLQVTSRDGVPLSIFHGSPTWAPVPMNHVRLSPASRMEFYLQASEVGRMILRTKAIDSGCLGDMAFERDLVLVHVKPSNQSPPVIRVPKAVDPVKMRFSDLAQQRPSKHRYFVFTEYNRDDEPIPDFYITELSNPKAVEHPFAMNGPPDVVVKSGTVEDWTILNFTQELHEFHMHQIHFLVLQGAGIENGEHQMLDTVDVPYGSFTGSGSQFVPGAVKLRMDFRDPNIIGTFVYHCHILSHEDNGMMAKIRVVK